MNIPKTTLFVIIFILLLFNVTAIMGCKDKITSGEIDVKREKLSGLSTTTIAHSNIQDVYELTGNIKARLSGNISARVTGEVIDVYVKEGDIVKKGQLLLKIDDSDISDRVRAAEKGMESAKYNKDLAFKTYQRYKALFDEKAVSGQEMDQVETQMKVAESEYLRAKAMLNEVLTHHRYTKVTAPYDGIISAKHIEKGSIAVQGVPLLSIESNDTYFIEVHVDESLLNIVTIGLPVNVNIDLLKDEYKAKVTEIIPPIDTRTRTFTVKINLPIKNIRSGMFARVKFLTQKREGILIKKEWIVQKGQLTGVYVVDEKGIVNYRLIKLGKTIGDSVEVISGLTPKERIISGGIQKAVEGAIVEGFEK